jgi:hypothetical protein
MTRWRRHGSGWPEGGGLAMDFMNDCDFCVSGFPDFHHHHNLMIYCSILLGISLWFAD